MNWLSVSPFMFSLIISVFVEDLQKVEIIDAVSREAVCNDGSPGVYYFERGSGDGAKRWVIFLMGGGFCSDYACTDRPLYLMSSFDTPERKGGSGLLSNSLAKNPDFYNANHVFIHYCSSDLWSGNRLETRGFRPIEYRGRKIFRSVIKDLMSQSAFQLSEPGTEILLAGWSAGGLGVLANLDWLGGQLPQTKVRGLNDAGWLPVESESGQDFGEDIAQAIPIWGGEPDQDCLRKNRNSKNQCYLSTVLPYITTPLFILESQNDFVFTGDHPAAFGKALRKSLVPVEAAFSPRTQTHGLVHGDGLISAEINGYSLAEVLGNWFFDRPGPVKVIQ